MEKQSIDKIIQNRVDRLQQIISDEKNFMEKKIMQIENDLLSSKKNKDYMITLEQRILLSGRFISNIMQTFFTMINDIQYLQVTTEIEVIQKIDKFKKNLFNSMYKITTNLANKNIKFKENMKRCQSQQQGGISIVDRKQMKQINMKKKQIKKKHKNSKMCYEVSMVMTEWLLQNFENPYPSVLDKQKIASQTNIEVTQVNNWFINARQRTIKGYFKNT